MHGKATTYYHCSTQGCKYSSTIWLARKCVREDQIKDHIKNYGHYGPHSPNRKKSHVHKQKDVKKLKPASEIDIIFEAWIREGEICPPVRTLIRRTLKTCLIFDDIIDEKYTVHSSFSSSANSQHFCSRKNCYFNKDPPAGLPPRLFPLSFATPEYLNQHQQRAEHPSSEADEGCKHLADFIAPPTEPEHSPQDVRPNNTRICEPSEKEPKGQIKQAKLWLFSPSSNFSACTELMPLTNHTTPSSLPDIERTKVISSEGLEDFHFSKSLTEWPSFTPKPIAGSPSTMLPGLVHEVDFATHGLSLQIDSCGPALNYSDCGFEDDAFITVSICLNALEIMYILVAYSKTIRIDQIRQDLWRNLIFGHQCFLP